jgi:ribosomal protein L7Ae-like RNA K-turn-binding protein
MGKSRRAEALALLGIARRAGAVVKGVDATRRGLRKGDVRLVLVSADASETQLAKVVPLAKAGGIPVIRTAEGAELGAALGEGALSAVGVTGHSFVKQLQKLLGLN